MMFKSGPPRVFLYTKAVDFRKQLDGLASVAQEICGVDPYCGAAFIFRPKRHDRIKIILWDGTGMMMIYKRLESGEFRWPRVEDGIMKLSEAQFAALFDGLEWRHIYSCRTRRPKKAA